MRTFILTLALITLFAISSYAQVFYEIEYNADLDKYVLSVHSEENWDSAPMNRTSTAQFTVKAPAGTFFPDNVESLIPNVTWDHNSTYQSPEEAEDFDYFSFGLSSNGTDGIAYIKGDKTAILSFNNKLDCSESVQLIDNESDPFLYPNKSGANIANHITILGAFKANSYSGNVNETSIPCQGLKKVEHKNFLREYFDIYPNPVIDRTNLTAEWPFETIEVEAEVLDLTGRMISKKQITLNQGTNAIEFDLSAASSGIYYIKLRSVKWDVTVDEIVKIE